MPLACLQNGLTLSFQAQLQLALFGEDDSFMEETNQKFRDSMQGLYDPRYVRPFCRDLSRRMKRATNTPPAVPGESGDEVRGPLSHALAELDMDSKTTEGNALIFAFAGHDTTGHTMTWFLYELAKNPSLQQRAQDEVDHFFEKELGDRSPTYEVDSFINIFPIFNQSKSLRPICFGPIQF
jgi:cytochrome P450